MKITRKSPFSGRVHTMEIDVTQEQLEAWERGALIQNVMPDVNPAHREFIMTGITPEEWDATFGDDSDD